MLSIDKLFSRNMAFAGGIHYDLNKVHGELVAQTLNTISDNLMIDAQALSVSLRACAAFHEDEGKVLLANVPQRAKSIGEFTLLITSMGTGKSLIFSKIMEMQQLKREYDLRREKIHAGQIDTLKNGTVYRHAILNEITGPGLTKYLDTAGNVFVLIDEFDGDHQKLCLFGTETKTSNISSSAASVLKSFHTGMPYYQKAKVSDSGHLKNPQVSFLAASNGAPVMDILRCKIKTSVMPDAMVMRTIFDVIDSPPKFNSDYKDKFMSTDAIGLELILLASSLLINQTYLFDTSTSRSADELLQSWQDMCVASGARWKNIDKWLSSRFAKTSELTARLAAQLTHIDLSYALLREFINLKQLSNLNGTVSFDIYCQMVEFFHDRYSPDSSTSILISSGQVEAAIYCTKIILLKFFNLFDLDANRSSPIMEIPWIPPSTEVDTNPAVVQLPTTQVNSNGISVETPMIDIFQNILKFPSICFTFSQLVKTFSKLKSQYKVITPMLEKLVQMEILLKYENGLRSGRNTCNIYVKVLPESITLNTVNDFVVNRLDPVKMPWAVYKSCCRKVLLPSPSTVLSDEVQQILNKENYLQIIEQYEKSPTSSKKRKESTIKTVPTQNNFINSAMMNNNGNVNTTSPTRLLEQNIVEEMEVEEQHEFSSILSSSSNSISNEALSPIASNSNLSISQILINPLLPRPPPPIFRSSNSDDDLNKNNDIEKNYPSSESTIQDSYNNLLINNENVDEENNDNDLTATDKNIVDKVRRSNRPRTKTKRCYSPDSVEDQTNLTSKKKNDKKNRKI